MKVEIQTEVEKEKNIEYPCLMISKHDGEVVLMKVGGCGISLDKKSKYFAYYGNDFNMDEFISFKGKVILSNS